MDSQLASVLTSGSLDVQNGSRSAEGSGPVSDPVLELEDQTSPGPAAGNLQPVRAALTSRPDAPSINGRKPEVGGTSEPASQETSKIGGFRQPITVKPGVPVLRSQPIRIKIVVPPRCKRPITNSAISLTKDFVCSHLRRPLLLSADKRRSKIHLSAVKDEAQVMEVTYQKNGAEETERKSKERDVLDVKIVHFDGSEAVKILSQQRIKEENAERDIERNIPLILDLKSCFEEEQTEPLDLSLPKNKESRERRCSGRFLEDSGAESSLIMEVDEYEGDGDRDVVEEDDDEDSLRPPSSFFSTSLDCDTENLLLIDDQGIPYTLSPDGLKVPQVDASTSEDSAEPEAKPSTPAGPSCSQSSENALNTPLEEFPSSPAPPPASPPGGAKQEDAPDVPADPMEAVEAVHPPPLLHSSQNIQILSNPPAGAPILLLSSQLSSPLQVASPGASTPMLLLLSSVPSSSGESTSTPIAVLDPATGQLSQITAASAPVSLPLASPLASPLPHPVIRLSPSNPPVVLNNPVIAVPERQVGYADSNPGTEAMSAEDDENKPLSFPTPPPAGSDRARSPPEEVQSPALDSRLDPADLPSEHLPLDDHLYFSSSAAPPSPPIGPLFPSGKLDPLDPLDPLSPASPGTVGSRRVLYCQLCPRVFFYLSDLERHAITHSQKKPHVCQQCGKAFKRSSHLQRHKHIHTGQRNFVCPICAKRFREAGELQRHQRVHTGEKPYQCQLCHTRFAERNTLRRHTKRKHPYHQVAMEMLNERRDRRGGGGAAVQDEEESAEWYNSTVSNLENSESETET